MVKSLLLLGVVSVPLWPVQAEVASIQRSVKAAAVQVAELAPEPTGETREDDDASEQSVQLAEADYARGYCRSVPWRLVGYRHTWSEAEQMMATELTRLERLVPPSSLASFHRQRIARDRLRLGIVAGRAAVRPTGKYDRIDIQPAWLSDTPYTRSSRKLEATLRNLPARLQAMLDEAGCPFILLTPTPSPTATPTPTPAPTPTPSWFEALVAACGGATLIEDSIRREVMPGGQPDGANVDSIRVELDGGWKVQQVKRRIWPMLPDSPANRLWETIAEGHITEDCEVIRRP